MILYGYALSSASYRVRIALALKGLPVIDQPKQLRDGEQRREDYLQINPQGLVPALALDDGEVLTQSMAIIEFLDEMHPQPALLPAQPLARDVYKRQSSPCAAARRLTGSASISIAWCGSCARAGRDLPGSATAMTRPSPCYGCLLYTSRCV